MIKIIQFILTDFAGKCNLPRLFKPKHERTFWIDKIISIFQSIGEGRSDIIVMKASSEKNNEDLEHSRDNTLKNVHGSICAVVAILRCHPNASFATASSLLTFAVQSICTTITLSTTALDPENIGGFLYQECRSVKVPVHYDEQIKWMKVFKLVSKLVIILRKQALIIDQLQKEQSGIIPIDNIETLRFLLS